MEWFASIAAVACVIWLMVRNKTFRYVALGLVALIGAGGWAWYEKTQADERTAYALIRPSEIEFRDARLSTGPLGKMTVTIKNNSIHPLSSVQATVTVFDCPEGQHTTSQCETVGQDTAWFGTAIPAGQVRASDAFVGTRGLPAFRGEMQWDYRIDRVRAARP